MRMIDRSSAFKRDYKREARGPRRATLDEAFMPVLAALATDQPLDARYRDNDLSGDWAGYRECHVKPDLLLIYRSQASTPFGWRGLDHTVNFLADGDTNGSGGCESPNTLIYWFLSEVETPEAERKMQLILPIWDAPNWGLKNTRQA